ncbi:nuclear transport factor 2 family protein [Leptothermofonsia sp. ETS-13]|uniref:nuclear transport factor 2 family protein n=1 Tax=Leptothermofonsia sp. ETS-13 TaxID=3035696 RepID=UPI003BA3441D
MDPLIAPAPAKHNSSLTPTLQDPARMTIEGVNEPVILRYFETLNSGAFQETSKLFATDGVLHPPFETEVVGREAIASYLEKEAKGLILQPKQGTSQILENGCTEYQIVGQVQTILFSVNVSWQFILSPWKELFVARIKLLASLQELVKLRK